MRVTVIVAAVVAASSVAGVARPLCAQSLDQLSRQEEERRKEVKAPARVYTNKDLGAPRNFSESADASKAGSAAPATPGSPAAATDKAADAGSKEVKDEKYWSSRKQELDAKLERDKVLADAMQTRINALTADFAARDDPAQRAQIERDRQRAVAELDGLQKSIRDDQKAIDDLQEDARKASVPPGWLR